MLSKIIIFLAIVSQITCQSGMVKSPNNCQGDDCDFTLYWNNKGSETVFTLNARTFLNSDAYAAFALSNDQIMGDDDVIVCKSDKVERMYNTGKSSPSYLVSGNPSIGLSDMVTKNVNGLITCSVTRQNSMPSVANYFSLNNNYFVLFAYGQTSGDRLSYHRLRTATGQKYYF